MSIDFATIKDWEIPEGKVTKIVDASGLILWSAAKMANLTITSFWDGMDGDTARITISSPSPFAPNPNEPNNKVTSWTAYVYDLFDQQNRTIKIPIGSTIECYITRDKGNADSYIKLNDVNVVTGEGTYVYTVTGDATIDVSEEYVQGDYGVISIVGAVTHISFVMNGETYQAIKGMSWKAWFASSYNTTGETDGTVKDANGNEVSLDAVIVNGAVYTVEFAPSGVTVTLVFTRQGAASFYTYASITVDGVSYPTVDNQLNLPTEEIIVPIGSVITCKVAGNVGTPQIKLNGKTVASGNNSEYHYTVVGEATIAASIAQSFTPQTGTQPYGTIAITEQ